MSYCYVTTSKGLQEVASVLAGYSQLERARLAVDVETYNVIPWLEKEVPRPIAYPDGTISGHIRTVQIGLDGSNVRNQYGSIQYIIDVKKLGYRPVAEVLKPYLESMTLVGQNLKYEYQFFFVHMGIRLRKMVDCMLISQILHAGDKLNHGLGDLYGRFLDYGWFQQYTGKTFAEYQALKKARQADDWSVDTLTEEQLQYAAEDVDLILYLLRKQLEKVDEWRRNYETGLGAGRGMLETIKLECSLIPVFALMELRGIKFDAKYHREQVIPYLEAKQKDAARKVGFTRIVKVKKSNGLRGKARVVTEVEEEQPLNLRSWQQLKPKLNELLSEALGRSVEIADTSEDTLKSWLYAVEDEKAKQVLSDLLEFKKASSLLSKYGEKLIELSCKCSGGFSKCDPSRPHWLHPSWYQIGTDDLAIDSGRSSCRNPNLQNIPSRGELFVTQRDEHGNRLDGVGVMEFFRRSFVADDGWIFLDADYAQEEPRIAAEVCGEKRLLDAYNSGNKVDIHGIIAQALLDLPYQPAKKTFERDYIGKTAGLALLYGIYPKALREFMYTNTEGRVDWSEAESYQYHENFFKRFPGFRERMMENEREVRRRAEAAGNTLAPFKRGRKPFAVAFTIMGRKRSFHLRADQMAMADHELHKEYVLLDPEHPNGKRRNVFRERMSSASRESFNHRIQGTAADILKVAMVDMEEQFMQAGFDWREGIVAGIHDEVLVHVRKENKDKAEDIIVRCMKAAGEKFLKQVPIDVDCSDGSSWAEAKLKG